MNPVSSLRTEWVNFYAHPIKGPLLQNPPLASKD